MEQRQQQEPPQPPPALQLQPSSGPPRDDKRRIAVSLQSPPPPPPQEAAHCASPTASASPLPRPVPSAAGSVVAWPASPRSFLASGSSGGSASNPFFDDDPLLHLGRHEQSPSLLGPSPSRSPLSGRRKDRTTRRSADVLQHVRIIDDENRTRHQNSPGIRETTKADVLRDDIGGLMGVNQYAIIKELGKGSFAEVKLCRKQNPAAAHDVKEDTGAVSSGSSVGASGEFPSSARGSPTSFRTQDEDEELYAIKIFSKSLLLRRKNFQRGQKGRMAVTTDLDKVQREIAIMKKLIHPHLVGLYEVIDDTTQDALYLVLEYVPGGAIMEYNADERRYYYPKSRDGTMSEVKAAKVLCDMLAGLVYLHMHHICHRDLKPENVLVDKYGRCKIADFGVAHYFEEEEGRAPPSELRELYRSHSRGLLSKSDGTWCFWAPEMCRAGSFSGYSCDVWAAGVCLWVFVFGSLPFLEDTPDDLFDAILQREPAFPDTKPISGELQELLLHFLQKTPADRITLGDALDHPWSQLADEDLSPGSGEGEAGVEEPPSPHRGTLRSRAYSFQQVHVTQDEIRGAIRTVNNFVLVNKLRKRLTQKLREARASLSRVYSPSASPAVSPAVSPANSPPESPDASRSPSPTTPALAGGGAGVQSKQHARSPSSSSPHKGAAASDMASAQPEGRRPSVGGSPYSFLPPAIVAAIASATPQNRHRKNKSSTGTSLGLSTSGARSLGASSSTGAGAGGRSSASSPPKGAQHAGGRLFRPSPDVSAHFGKEDEEAEEQSQGKQGEAEDGATKRDSLVRTPPPAELPATAPSPSAELLPRGKPPRSLRSLVGPGRVKGGSPPPPPTTTTIGSAAKERAKRESCTIT